MHLFCYGTLQFPEVMARVCGVQAAGRHAILEEFACYRVADRTYPGIVPCTGAQTRGMVYTGIDRRRLARLDAYEGDEYRRRQVRVRGDDGRLRRAWTYVYRTHLHALLSDEPWDRDAFARHELAAWLQRIA